MCPIWIGRYIKELLILQYKAIFYVMSEIFISGWANPHAKRLYDDLLSNYNRLIRPVENNTDHLTVKLGLKLSQLIDVVSTKLLLMIIF